MKQRAHIAQKDGYEATASLTVQMIGLIAGILNEGRGSIHQLTVSPFPQHLSSDF